MSHSAFDKHYIFNLKSVGTSDELRGKVRVQAVLLSNAKYPWNARAEASFKKKLETAMQGLTEAAAASGVSLSVSIDYDRFSEENTPAYRDYYWAHAYAVSKGFRCLSDYLRLLCVRRYCDSTPVLFVWNRPLGESAMCAEVRSADRDEYSVLSSMTDIKTIQHELLHQFGAMDFYLPPDAKTAAEKHFPGTVMIDGTHIDSLTRYLIGWESRLSDKAIAFLKDTAHYTTGDCIRAKLERLKSPSNVTGIPTENGNPIVPFSSFAALRREAKNGHSMACFLLSFCYTFGILVEKNIPEALRIYRHTKAPNVIASYFYACDVTYSKKRMDALTEYEQQEMIAAYELAVSGQHIWAMNNYGLELIHGKRIPKDIPRGLDLLARACTPQLCYDVLIEYKNAVYYTRYIPELHNEVIANSNRYEESCLGGNPLARYNLAHEYQSGENLPRDEKKAFELFMKDAEAEDIRRLFEIAYCYEEGLGVAADRNEAARYYARAEAIAKKRGLTTFNRESFRERKKKWLKRS